MGEGVSNDFPRIPRAMADADGVEVRGASLGPVATNAYALRCPQGWAVIDAPEGCSAWLEEQGIEPDLLLLTHQHFDHVLGAAELLARYGCPSWAFSEPSPDLTLENLFASAGEVGFQVAEYQVDSRLEPTAGASPIDVLGVSTEVLHVPGHSPDSVCFAPQGAGVVFGGDVLFQAGIGRTDFPGGDQELLLSGIREKLFPLGDELVVYPGHGPQTTLGHERANNPFLQ